MTIRSTASARGVQMSEKAGLDVIGVSEVECKERRRRLKVSQCSIKDCIIINSILIEKPC